MTTEEYDVLHTALNVMTKGPTSLAKALSNAPRLANLDGKLSITTLFRHLNDAQAQDAMKNRLRESLIAWDYELSAKWVGSTIRNTAERRQRIYDLLELEADHRQLLDNKLPFAPQDPVIIIAKEFTPWYSDTRRLAHNFYWSKYKQYLADVRGFEPENVVSLDESTSAVVERLTDPEQVGAYQSKGLVVGYVQSGKTANFTGVIAKAIDAGYRLVIVLSGTTDLLRDQTQRRIDMELVGKEQITRHQGDHPDERHDYDDDPQWDTKFLSFGALPSAMGAFDILRLTGAGQLKGSIGDYQSLKQGIQTLEFERVDKKRPLYDPANLHVAAVRIMVVKKNGPRLAKLVKDFKRIGAQYMSQVPALIIDDESDQASINTIKPDKKFLSEERRRRSTINLRLTELLSILPRAQYVGYTATPFANVFVDPADAEGIFPKDFIISLPRPTGYMGVSDFHDLVRDGDDLVAKVYEDPNKRTPANSNREAHVRSVTKPHSKSTEMLRSAIDTFVLTGAIKLWRANQDVPGDFTHHTMLVHESQFTDDHEELANLICEIWSSMGYDGGGGRKRLESLLEADILPTSSARAEGLSIPKRLEVIENELGEVLHRIDSGDRPVLVVNGDKDADTPNFDKVPVWKIVVGGAKLSRGYTVEGLTVSYFRRRATYQDTLMQMGRWFGFRPGYRDLVRLYIGRHEPLTPAERRFIDLYAAFEAICVDEESFRRQICRYARPTDGSKPLTPLQIPPLVTNSHPQLKPAARNRMYNAVLKSRNFGGQWIERTLLSDVASDLKHNEELLKRLVRDAADFRRRELWVKGEGASAPGVLGIVPHSLVLGILGEYLWAKPDATTLLQLELDFLRGKSDVGDPEIDDWVLYMPQVKSNRTPWRVDNFNFATVERSRIDNSGRFKAFSEPRHRHLAEIFANISDDEIEGDGSEFAGYSRRGTFLLYPTYPFAKDEPDWPEIPAMGLSILPPANSHPHKLGWGVADPKNPEEPIVPVPE